MKIKLEIGVNLRSAIKDIVDECSHQVDHTGEMINLGNEVAQAFGINFVKLMEKNPELGSLFLEVEKKPDISKLDDHKEYHGSKLQTLHRHPVWEQELNIDPGFVIIHLEIFNWLFDQHGQFIKTR